MQLVYTSEHKAKLPHEGAVKQFEIGVEYDTKAAKDKAKELNEKYHQKNERQKLSLIKIFQKKFLLGKYIRKLD